jgi:hypothetical protein
MRDAFFFGTLVFLIPILAITVSLGALIVWIVTWHRRKMHEIDSRHKERMAAIEKGVDLPPEPPPPEQVAPHSRYLLRGLVWLGVGIAIKFGGHQWLDRPLGGAGWIPIGVGAAYLIFYCVETFGPGAQKRRLPAPGGDQMS